MSLRLTNLVGFGGGFSGPPIEYTDHGQSDIDGFGSSSFSQQGMKATTREVTFVISHWKDGSTLTLTSLTWNGNSGIIIVQNTRASGIRPGVAITRFDGQGSTGNMAVVMSGGVDRFRSTILAVDLIKNVDAIDTDTANANAISSTLDALTDTSAGGITILGVAIGNASRTITWTPGADDFDELDDSSVGGLYRAVSCIRNGPGTGDVVATLSGSENHALVGATFR